nr:TPA_asm: polymerase [Allium ophiovirus]
MANWGDISSDESVDSGYDDTDTKELLITPEKWLEYKIAGFDMTLFEKDSSVYLKEYDGLLISLKDKPFLLDIIGKSKESFIQLMESREEEKAIEPPEPEFHFESKLIHKVTWKFDEMAKKYTDKPWIMSKIKSPFRLINEDFKHMIFKEDLYPEKSTMRMKIDIYRLRNFLKEFSKDCSRISANQQSSIDIFQILSSYGKTSTFSDSALHYAENLELSERQSIEYNLIGKSSKMELNQKKTEYSNNTLNSLWVLNLLETINLKVKLAYNAQTKKRKMEKSVNFNENRRINTQCYTDGSSITKIEIEDCDMIDVFYLFLSQSFTAFSCENIVFFGNADMMNYLMAIADHQSNLLLIKDIESNKKNNNEEKFIDYITNLLYLKTESRVGLASLYESTCLLMSDYRSDSSTLPLIDNLVDSIMISAEKTEELVKICINSEPDINVKMSCIGKVLIYAELNEDKGLRKYTQRTNRMHKVDKKTIEDLRSLFRMKVVTNYVRKYGIMPNLYDAPDILLQELSLMASKGNFSNNVVSNSSNYRNLRLGKMVEMGQEMNVSTRIIDKACTKDKYDPSGNSIKELIYYIEHNNLTEMIEEICLPSSENNCERIIKILDRKDEELIDLKEGLIVRLVEKEKELKSAARFFGVGSFKLKIYISTIMELVKRAMKLIPGQMMTMTEDERRTIMHKMSVLLNDKNSYSIFLDYSGHNTSQRPDNNLFIMEEIADMYGFDDNSDARKHFLQVLYVFNNIDVIYENPYSDTVYLSKYQRGAIEGWLGPLWGIQSQLMMEDMFKSLGFKNYIATTYSDDSCGVFIEKELNERKLNDIISRVQSYALKMGLLVKLSQTQVTNGRCSMLKNHYVKGRAIENNYKRIMGISPNTSVLWGDELEMIKNIDSGYTSSVSRSNNHKLQTIIRNYRVIMIIRKEIMRFSYYLQLDLDHRYYLNSFAENYLAKIYYRKGKFNDIISLPSEENIINDFFLFNQENIFLLKSTLMLFYMPYSMYGFACTPIPDAILSGYSISNIKRISYIESILEGGFLTGHLYSFIEFSEDGTNYINNPFPMIGGRHDTSLLLKDVLKEILPSRIKNSDLLNLHNKVRALDKEQYLAELITTFKECFSARIVSKFYECSIFSHFDEIYSKIDNSTTFSYIIGKLKVSKLWNKAWERNHKIEFRIQNNFNEIELDYEGIIEARDNVKKHFKLRDKKHDIRIKFLKIEEVPLLGKIMSDEINGQIVPVKQGMKDETRKLRPPTKTNVNKTKFDRDLEIEGMFQNKLIFLSYELVRYVKWIIMDMEKYSQCSEETKNSLYKISDSTLSTFSNVTFKDLSEHVVAPKGGRYFHRAVSAGFNPKTGDLSSNEETQKYEITGVQRLIESTGGVDNNINLQYLMMSLKASLSYINPSSYELQPLRLKNDVLKHCRDVSFVLSNMKPDNMITTFYSNDNILTELKEIRSKAKLYKSFSYFISTDDNITGKFINHSVTIPNEIIMRQNSFRSVHKYMEDQGILSPETIPDETLIKLAPELEDYSNRYTYFDDFYRFYKGLNIIDNETPTRSVIRSLLYNELFRPNESGGNWTREICEKGYSKDYRNVLLKLFLISTSLVYRLEELRIGEYRININETMTIMNGVNNLRRIKNNKAHFHIKDKRISELLLMAFPTSGYLMYEIREGVSEILKEYQYKSFQQYQLNSYYNEEVKHYVSEDDPFTKNTPNDIDYEMIEINPIELLDKKRFMAAIKGFEMICAMNCKPKNVSSPTMSDVFPSIFSAMKRLMESNFIKKTDRICDLFAGRGDSHLCMNLLNIKHNSVSRNDGYNLINRIKGMTEIKSSIDITDRENYIQYVNYDIFLIDISHFNSKAKKLSEMINELCSFNKRIIIRINSIMKYMTEEIIEKLSLGKTEIMIPSVESPGYIYLIHDPTGKKIDLKGSKKNKISDSIVLEKLVNSINSMSKVNLFDNDKSNTKDHTEELISDSKLTEMLISNDPDYIEMPCFIEDEIKSKVDIESMIFTPVPYPENLFDDDSKKNNAFIKELIEKEKLKIYNPRLLIAADSKITNYKHAYLEAQSKNFPDTLIVNNYIGNIGVKGFIISYENLTESEIFELTKLVISHKSVTPNSLIMWKFMHKLSEGIIDKIYSSEILENLNLSKLKPDQSRTIDKLYHTTHTAIKAYKSGKIIEGLMIISGMKKPNMNELMKNKSKAKRYDCLNYKLIINRITRIHRNLALNISYNYMKIKDLLRSHHKRRINDKEEKELIEFISSFDTVEDYFKNQKSNDLFDAFVESLQNEMSMNPSCELIGDMESGVSELMNNFITDTSIETYEKNTTMTYEELEDALENLSDQEYEEYEDY